MQPLTPYYKFRLGDLVRDTELKLNGIVDLVNNKLIRIKFKNYQPFVRYNPNGQRIFTKFRNSSVNKFHCYKEQTLIKL